MNLKIQSKQGNWYKLIFDPTTNGYQVWTYEGGQLVRCKAFEGPDVDSIRKAIDDPWSVLRHEGHEN